jgi:hypothetical protein
VFDVLARHFCDPVHHFKHSREDLLQEIRLFTDDFFRDNVRERQDASQPVQNTRRYLFVLVLFFQELNSQALPSAADTQEASTNLKRNVGNSEDSLCDWVQLLGVNALLLSRLETRTSANTAPYLIALSTALSVDPCSSAGAFP